MADHNCYIYPEPRDKGRDEVIDLLSHEAKWDRTQTLEFLKTNDVIIFKGLDKTRALHLIAKFEVLDIVGSTEALDAKYLKKFKKFMHGYAKDWNWWSAFFQTLWLICKGLWTKFALYWMALWAISTILPDSFFAWIVIVNIIYFGMFGSYDYYLQVAKGENLWPEFPFKKWNLLFWFVFILFLWFVIMPSMLSGVQLNIQQSVQQKTLIRDA